MKAAWGGLLGFLLMTSMAVGAEVVPVRGEVLVNTGIGYQVIAGAVRLRPGNSVIARPDAQGSLTYADGCVVDVIPGMVAWVEPRSPCVDVARGAAVRDPAPALAAPHVFDPAWLVGGAPRTGARKMPPAGP